MARQGNYVQVSGNTNWAAPLSSSLSNLSKSLLDQDAQSREEERVASRTAVLDKRAAEDLKLRKSEINRAITRDRASDKRANANLDMNKQEFAHKQNKRKAEKDIALFTTNFDITKHKFGIADYAPEQQEKLNATLGDLAAERDSTAGYLDSISRGRPDINLHRTALQSYEKRLLDNGVTPAEANKLKLERGNRLEVLARELNDTKDPNKRKEILNYSVNTLYKPQEARIRDAISSGKGLLLKEQVNAIARNLDPDVRQYYTADELTQKLGSMITAPSRQSLQANELAKVNREDAASRENIKGVKSFYTALGKPSSSGGSGGFTNTAKAIDKIAALDIGPFDKDKAKFALEQLLEVKGIDPQIAASVIALNVDKNIFGESFTSDTDELAKMKVLATELSTRNSSGGSGGSRPKLSDFQYTPAKARELTDIMRSRVSGFTTFNDRLTINSDYIRPPKPQPAVPDKPTPNPVPVPTPVPEDLKNIVLPNKESRVPTTVRNNAARMRSPSSIRNTYVKPTKEELLQQNVINTATSISALRSLLDRSQAVSDNTAVPSFLRGKADVEVKAYTNQLKEKTNKLIALQNELNPQ
jgi:hypothetical protein